MNEPSTDTAADPVMEALDESADRAASTPETPPFAWGKFFSALGSIVVVLMLAGIGAAAYWGWTPLEKRAKEIADSKITRIEIEWPRIGDAKPKPAAAVSTPTPADEKGASVREVRDSRAGKNSGKNAARNTKKPEPVKEEPKVEVPWSQPVTATTWLPEQFQEELLNLARRTLGDQPDPLSREPLLAVEAAMEQSGWFNGKPELERRAGGVLWIRGSWRVPAAVVRQGDKDYLLSWDGMPMPVEYKIDQSKLPAIVGVVATPPVTSKGRDFATPWPGDELEAAMELLKTLAVEPWYTQVGGVDVQTYKETRKLVLMTTSGGRVVWGGRASKPLAGEASTKNKLQRIATINKRFGKIDAGLDGKTQQLEIYWGQGPLVLNIAATNTGPLVEAPLP